MYNVSNVLKAQGTSSKKGLKDDKSPRTRTPDVRQCPSRKARATAAPMSSQQHDFLNKTCLKAPPVSMTMWTWEIPKVPPSDEELQAVSAAERGWSSHPGCPAPSGHLWTRVSMSNTKQI